MKIGLIGYGNIAKKHEAALAKIDSLDLVGIYDVQPIIHDNVATTTDLAAFLKEDIDLITVCSPNGYHKTHSLQALAAGKHVMCEKPFALASTDCKSMIAQARASNKKVFCTMQNRYSPVSEWLKKIVQENQLGDIYLVNVACYWNRNKNYYQQASWRGKNSTDGGTLFTQFSHYVDTIYWLFGKMNILNGHFQNFDHEDIIEFEDTGIFNFTLANGGMGTFSYTTSCYEKNFESSLTITGSKGTIKVAGQYMDTVVYCNIHNEAAPTLAKNNNLNNITQHYKKVINEINSSDDRLSSAEDALNVVEIIEDVYKFRTLT